MFEIDAIEVIVGTLGLASSIYDPWVGDPFAPILVTFARTAGVTTLFLADGLGLLWLAVMDVVEFDPTIVAVLLFAISGAAPIIARGAWSIMDMATMFNDVMYTSYKETNCVGPASRPCGVDKMGVRDTAAWSYAVFLTLMSHNVSYHKLAPYTRELYNAFGNNVEVLIHGKPVYQHTAAKDCWDFGWSGWAQRLAVFLNIVVLNAMGAVFLLLQVCATLGEGLLLAVGSTWVTIGIAINASALHRAPTYVSPTRPLAHVVEDLICCTTCNHKVDDRSHRTGTNTSDNQKAYLDLMPKIANKSKANGHGNHFWFKGMRELCCPR